MLRLISWNVNGLRACINKGFLDYFNEVKADIFCVQETKLQEEQLKLDIEGYTLYQNCAVKKGYSGVAVFTKIKPLTVSCGIGIDEFDDEGRVITLEFEQFFLVNQYAPNSRRELARLDYRLTWEDAFRNYLKRLMGRKPVVVCGDFNVAHMEIDLKNPSSNRTSAGFSDQERESFDKLLKIGFIDTFRYLHPDKENAYTWWSYMFKAREKNIGWRIDYFCVTEDLKDKLLAADIHCQVMGSDHCPVELVVDI